MSSVSYSKIIQAVPNLVVGHDNDSIFSARSMIQDCQTVVVWNHEGTFDCTQLPRTFRIKPKKLSNLFGRFL